MHALRRTTCHRKDYCDLPLHVYGHAVQPHVRLAIVRPKDVQSRPRAAWLRATKRGALPTRSSPRAPIKAKAVALLLLIPAAVGLLRVLCGLVCVVQDGILFSGNWLVTEVASFHADDGGASSVGLDDGGGAAAGFGADTAASASGGASGSEMPSEADSLSAEISGDLDLGADPDPSDRLSTHLAEMLRLGVAPDEFWAGLLAGFAAAAAGGANGGGVVGGMDPTALGLLSGVYVRYLGAWLALAGGRACTAAFWALWPLQQALMAADVELLAGRLGTLLRAALLMLPSLALALRLPWLRTLAHVARLGAAERWRSWRERRRGSMEQQQAAEAAHATAATLASAAAVPAAAEAAEAAGRWCEAAEHSRAGGRGAGHALELELPMHATTERELCLAGAPSHRVAAAGMRGGVAAAASQSHPAAAALREGGCGVAAGSSHPWAAVQRVAPPRALSGVPTGLPRSAAACGPSAAAEEQSPSLQRVQLSSAPGCPCPLHADACASGHSVPSRYPPVDATPSGPSAPPTTHRQPDHGDSRKDVREEEEEKEEEEEASRLAVNVLRAAALLGSCAAATVVEAGLPGSPWPLRAADMAVTAAISGAALWMFREVWARGGGSFRQADAAQPLRLATWLMVAQACVGVAHAVAAASPRSCLLPLLAGALACHNCLRLRDDPREAYRQLAYVAFPLVLGLRLAWLGTQGIAV